MATIFKDVEIGDDPVIIEDPGGGGVGTTGYRGRLLLKSLMKLPSLEANQFHPIWLARVASVTVIDHASEAEHGPFLNPASIEINNGTVYTSGVFSFSGARVTNVDPPAQMELDDVMEGNYYVYFNGGIDDKISTIQIDGAKIQIKSNDGVTVRFKFADA